MVSCFCHGKNNFAEVSKNLGTYRSETNFVQLLKQLCTEGTQVMIDEQYYKNFDNNYFERLTLRKSSWKWINSRTNQKILIILIKIPIISNS